MAEKDKSNHKVAAIIKQCPLCGGTDIQRAYIEDGSMGEWCPQCKKSLQKMAEEKETPSRLPVKAGWGLAIFVGAGYLLTDNLLGGRFEFGGWRKIWSGVIGGLLGFIAYELVMRLFKTKFFDPYR